MSRESDAPGPTSRRDFLKGVGAGATVGGLAPTPSPAALPKAAALLLTDSEVRGIGYHLGSALVERITPSARIVLRRDLENGHDPAAVAIHLTTGERIGYIPREENRSIAALLDAGHDVRAEIVEVDRVEFETRLSGDGKPFPGRVVLQELGLDDDGVRRVRMAEVRPRFKAWLATGAPQDAEPPDPSAVPGWPGWKKLVPEFEPRTLHGQKIRENAAEIQPGIVLSFEDRRTDPDERFQLVLPSGAPIGSLEGDPAESIGRAIDAGLEIKVVVTRVKRDDGAAPDSFGLPWLEVRCQGDPPPLPAREVREFRRQQREAARSVRFQRDMELMVARSTALDAKHRELKAAIAAAQSRAAELIASGDATRIGPWLAERDALVELAKATHLGTFALRPVDNGRERRDGIVVADCDGCTVLIAAGITPGDPAPLDELLATVARLGVDRASLVWVAPQLDDGRKAAIAWLNQQSGKSYRFFGVEVDFTGEPPAPRFRLVAAPGP